MRVAVAQRNKKIRVKDKVVFYLLTRKKSLGEDRKKYATPYFSCFVLIWGSFASKSSSTAQSPWSSPKHS